MEYKGYKGVMEVDDEAGIIFGHVIGLRGAVTFQGETVAEARQDFRDSVDDYLDFCAQRGEKPEKPFSGKFMVRLKPDLHRALANEASTRQMSINALFNETLAQRFPQAAQGRANAHD